MRTIAAAVGLLPATAAAQGPRPVDAAIDRGLDFLATGARAWQDGRNRASCHHAAVVVRSLAEAERRGPAADGPFPAGYTRWVGESGDGGTSVPRPAGIPKALNAKAVWFALARGADPGPDAAARKGLAVLLEAVREDQTGDGSWASGPDTRPPILGHADDGMTALATLALPPPATRRRPATGG